MRTDRTESGSARIAIPVRMIDRAVRFSDIKSWTSTRIGTSFSCATSPEDSKDSSSVRLVRFRAHRLSDFRHRDPTARRYLAKCSRTFAAIWRSVILSTVSRLTMRPPSLLFSSRFFSSPFASPGPNMKMASASPMAAITAS